MEAECRRAAGHCGERDEHPHTSPSATLQPRRQSNRENKEVNKRLTQPESILTDKVRELDNQ